MKVHPSALKHGIEEADAAQAAEWPLWIEPLDDGPPRRELRLGFDTAARLLETVVLIFENDSELARIFHDLAVGRRRAGGMVGAA